MAGSGTRGRRRPTIDDVARSAGVSRGTVSRVLNGGHYVSADAFDRVSRAMKQTGYVTNHSARALATGRTNAVGLVIPEAQDRLFEDPTFNVLLRAATQTLIESDVAMVLLLAGSGATRAKILRYIRAGHLDGIMVVSDHAADPIVPSLLELGVPTVVCGRPLESMGSAPFVAADDREGGRLLTQHLLDTGRTRIGMIAGPLDTSGGVDRLAGYRDALGTNAHEDLVVAAGSYSHSAGQAAMTRLLNQVPDLDAVFVGSDLLAAGAVAELRRRHIDVPGDVAVGGFDDSILATTTRPSLTTVRQPLEDVAREMVSLLMECIAGTHTPASRVLPVSLVQRDST